ncbi:phosphotransferase family protein [Geminicoccus roseus]|uniref:phosphotransferase family protein n=1 Tax=Geminicoccus roseus TaxID=404900 RepID=UPI000408DD2E|nr:phosphotransferase family protein [Geminicoccus roseus]
MLDQPALERLVADQTGASACRIERLALLGGGAIQENWAVDLLLEGGSRPGRHALVLRTDAASSLAVSHGRMEEFALVQVAHRAGVTVPEPWFACADPAVIGKRFYLMARVAGEARGQRLTKDPALLAAGPALASRLGRELARLHRVRPPVAELGFLEIPDQPVALLRVAQYRAHLDALGRAEPVLEWALRRLELRAPAAVPPVLCHGDFRTGNYMVQDGQLTTILDWEFAAWADPMEDLGWMLSRPWRFANPQLEAGGIASAEDLLKGYEAEAGAPVDRARIRYWQAMAVVRWAVVALLQADRHLSGAQSSLELALTGHVVPELEAELLATVPGI